MEHYSFDDSHLPKVILIPIHFIMTLFLSIILLKMTIATLDFFNIGSDWLQSNSEIGFMILVLVLLILFLIFDELLMLITDTGGLISIFLNSMKNKYDVAKYIEDGQHSTIKASDFIKEDHIEINNDVEINKDVKTEIDIEIETDNNIEINIETETDNNIEIDDNIEINNKTETDTTIETDEEMEINLKAEICDLNFIDTDKLFAEFPSDPQGEVPMTNKTEDCSDQVLFTMGLKKPRKYDET